MNGGGGGVDPVATAMQLQRLNTAVGLLQFGMDNVNLGVAQIGLADVVSGQPLGPTLAGRLQIHTGFGYVQGALADVIGIIYPPVAPQAPGLPNGGAVV